MSQATQSLLISLLPSSTSKAHALLNVCSSSTFSSTGSRQKNTSRTVSVSRRGRGKSEWLIEATLRDSQTEVARRVEFEEKPLLDRGKVEEKVVWKGTVVLERLNFLDLNNYLADVRDRLSELFGARVNLQLVSAEIESETGEQKRSEKACLENWVLKRGTWTADTGTEYSVSFKVDENFGLPGAILVENEHPNPFLLRKMTLELQGNDNDAGAATILEFACDSWVYDPKTSGGSRIFFINQTYLPGQTPPGLEALRRVELQNLRGTGSGKRVSSDRIYDYDVYNDLGAPDKGVDYRRPVLGGSTELPYPRRCRTGRARSKSDPSSEELASSFYVPRDEVFDRIKESDFLGSGVKSVLHLIVPGLKMLLKLSFDFKSFKEIHDLYSKVVPVKREKIPRHPLEYEETGSLEILREITDPRGGDPNVFRFPYPQIIQVNDFVWCLDEEFARQMVSGLNPMVIQRLQVFPPVSTLDSKIYGPALSAITAEHIEQNLDGMTVDEAIRANKMYIVDYHDAYLPFVERINKLKGKGYASRTLLFLTKKGSLKPVAIELSLPPSADGSVAKSNRVFVPPADGRKTDHIWNLAKTHAIINDVGYHEVVSHWLRTHACMEPFIIATHRQLSVLHPIYRLLVPHFKNTMNINTLARSKLINSFSGSLLNGGIIEYAFTTGRYSMEMGADVYKTWRLDEQALPTDLIKRGMAERDMKAEHGVRVIMEDYPYAVDGLEIWGAIKGWATDYVNVYYQNDEEVAGDEELQAWWKEIREVGHGDHKDKENWWVELDSMAALVEVMATLIWVPSSHHAAVNFGQFSYGGFPPSRPTMGRRLIPIQGSKEYNEFTKNHEEFYMKTISSEAQSLVILATLEILSTHSIEEQYLGHHTPGFGKPEFSSSALQDAITRFRERIKAADQACQKRNAEARLINRRGDGFIPYTLLLSFSSEPGLSGRGIPNSISI